MNKCIYSSSCIVVSWVGLSSTAVDCFVCVFVSLLLELLNVRTLEEGYGHGVPHANDHGRCVDGPRLPHSSTF